MTVLVVAGAIGLSACSSSSGPNGPQGGDCTTVPVAASSEKVNMIQELGTVFAESEQAKSLPRCAKIVGINVPSGNAARILSGKPNEWPLPDRGLWPVVWSPASTVWTDRVTAAGAGALVADAASFTRTPVVLGMPESMAKTLGYPGKDISVKALAKLVQAENGWGSVGQPLWGSFKVAKTNPNSSTTGLSMILMQSYAAAGKSRDLSPADIASTKAFSQAFEEGAIHYGDTTGNVLTTLYNATKSASGGSTYVSALALEEASLFNYNKGNPDSHVVQSGETLTPPSEKLVAVYPAEGSMWSDNPAVVLKAPWVSAEQRAAGDAFLKFLATPAAQQVLPKYGFRPLDPGVDVSAHLNAGVGIDPSRPRVTLPKPAAATVSAALDAWAQIRKPSAVLEVIDLSGSMTEDAGNGRSKLDGAIKGAQDTLGNFRGTDEVGIWVFTTELRSALGTNLAPVRNFAPLGGDRERMKTAIEALRQAPKGSTPLYDAVAAAYDFMLPRAKPGRINAIVVLSDGEDTTSALSLESLLVKINSSAKEGGVAAPVRIFTIAYGKDASKEILGRISAASGGQMFDATDPTKIQEVFASVINNF